MKSELMEYDFLADRIRLARQADSRPVVIVEGLQDKRFVLRMLDDLEVETHVAGSRTNVIDIARQCAAWGISRIAGVVDRDFDDVVADAEKDGLPLAVYDNADLESMLWHSQTLDQMLEEVGSARKLDSFGGVEALRNQARIVLAPLTRLRRANAIYKLGLPFDDVDLSRKIDKRSLELDPRALCDALWHEELAVSRLELYRIAVENLSIPVCEITGTELLRGRDALVVAAVALRRLIGSMSHQEAVCERLEQTLRLSARRGLLSTRGWIGAVEHLLT